MTKLEPLHNVTLKNFNISSNVIVSKETKTEIVTVSLLSFRQGTIHLIKDRIFYGIIERDFVLLDNDIIGFFCSISNIVLYQIRS